MKIKLTKKPTSEELHACANAERLAYPFPESFYGLAGYKLRADGKHLFILASEGREHAGQAVVNLEFDPHSAHLSDLEVAPLFQGQGIGASLLREAEKAAVAADKRTLRLDCKQKNHKAIAFYSKQGYDVFGVVQWDGKKESGFDVLMQKRL